MAHFRGPNQARANGSTEDVRQKAPGARQVTDSLRSPDLSPDMARELRKHVAVLEREIAELATS
jgi:hypothetical protein